MLLAAHHLCRLFVPSMRERPRGDVVFVSSVAARLLAAGGAPYNMAKAALEALAVTLAERREGERDTRERGRPGARRDRHGTPTCEGDGCRRHCLASMPSSPFGRVCRPEDVADAVQVLVL